MYYMIQSAHQEESDKNTVKGVAENKYPQLDLVYRAQDRYRALYDLILNPGPVDDGDPDGGSPDYLLSKIRKYRAGCLCGTKESGSNGRMEHACPSGMKFSLLDNA